MNILEKIVEHKRQEVSLKKQLYPIKLLEQSIYYEGQCVSMKKYVTRQDKSGIIAEFKRKSPSKGDINAYAKVEKTTIGYMQAGASGLSILTDKEFFGGKSEDLETARRFNFCPILRKDFILDEYQVIEAKSIGADCILLIATILSPEEIKALSSFAKGLGLEVLMEVHDQDELQRSLCDSLDLIGVNNRNLKTFETDIQTSIELAELIPNDFVKISESGLSDPVVVMELKKYGYKGFLMGEHFMKAGSPEKACKDFIDKLNFLTEESPA
ncbi:MAG: indole-3-glycerol phosphate synthase TrpC [Cyclobacteriaceae bacterium]